ncbi:MAG: baseplate J/gp47 family protein, partial [Synergistaceae bacterium]|nr:baseplate J/gp47 family protein [Synergistaceae bacterium]
MKSELFPALNDITFANKTPEEIESEIIKIYENLSGRSLARGDPVRLFLETIILVIIHQRALIDHSAKMNLLAYATGDYLDHLGALLGVMRLEASSALTTLKFTLSEAQEANILIPVGTRATPDGTIYFATT